MLINLKDTPLNISVRSGTGACPGTFEGSGGFWTLRHNSWKQINKLSKFITDLREKVTRRYNSTLLSEITIVSNTN